MNTKQNWGNGTDERRTEACANKPVGKLAMKAAGEIMAAASCSYVLPEFGRTWDVHRIFGIKRGVLYQKINDGTIKSISLREPGKKFGCRLIHLKSVHDWLMAEMEKQNGATPKSQSQANDSDSPAPATAKLSGRTRSAEKIVTNPMKKGSQNENE